MIQKHLFFDLDRTLWDFDSNSHDALSQIFDRFCLQKYIKNKRDFIATYNRVNESMWADYRKGLLHKHDLRVGRFIQTLQKFGVNDNTLAEAFSDAYVLLSPQMTKLFPGTLETLEVLKRMNYKMHIITNGFSEVQHIKLRSSGLNDFFEVVLCSDVHGFSKPDVKIFQIALEQTGAKPSDSVMIGDHLEVDVLGANAVGIQGVLFDPKNEYKRVLGITKIHSLPALPPLLLKMH